ncbi:MAG TPA: monofunctional biosynthetic peptidoglycan transglycosylase [Halalkalibaculum sp.]|nr:monofunctional biosynthetic peptidoglycan transglycosylase [Halalkalibaculum sp.]
MESTDIQKKRNPFKKAAKLLAAALIAFIYLSFLSVLLLKWFHPPTSAFMLQRQLEVSLDDNQDFEINYEWADWQEISPYVKVAAITSEDQRYADHWGLDMDAIEQAIDEHQRGESLRGASTITQQTAKNLFLWPGQSFVRKGIEAYFALLMEGLLSKKRILEIYLNIAEFGNGVYGVKAASNIYFNTEPSDLDMMQSALMVTALPSPRRYNLADPSPYMIERRNWILQYMFYLGNTDYLKKLE